MKQGIVVCTWSGGQNWLWICLNSLAPLYDKYPTYVVVNDADNAPKEWLESLSSLYKVFGLSGDNRELGAFKVIVEQSDLDEFWLFQDSIEILDTDFIESTFENYPDVSATYMPNWMQFYLGKWKTSVLKKIEIPIPKDKIEAILYEYRFANQYRAADPKPGIVIDQTMRYDNFKSNYMDYSFGEERFAVVGKFLIKRLSVVKENFREGTEDNWEFMSDEAIEKWKNSWRRMYPPP